jgi:predicted cation transporter
MLTLIAATFTLAMAVIGITTYQTYTTYSLYYGVETPEAIGFLIFSGVGFAAAALGFLTSMFSFRGNRYKLALIGSGVMCASAFVTILIVYIFALGFSDGIISTAVPTLVFALAGLFFISNSKAGFTDYVAPSEDEEDTEDTESEETSEDDKESKFDESVFKE